MKYWLENNQYSKYGFGKECLVEMKMVEELLEEKNEKILNKLDEVIGLSKNKSVLRDIIRYHKVMQECKCNIEFENYNIVIRNESNYNLYEELIPVIAELYYKNGIISNSKILYFDRENFRDNKPKKGKSEEKNIEEGLIVIDLNELRMSTQELKKEIEKMLEPKSEKAFIILADEYREGIVNAALTDYFSWSMKIETISSDEKEKYIKKFLDSNNLTYNDEIVKELADNPYYMIKNKLINILVDCKIKKEKNVAKVLNKKEKIKKSEKTGMQELEELTGLDDVKKQIKKVINFVKLSKDRKNMPMLHMCFNGNPGTGKTTVARIVGKIFSEEKILSEKEIFVEAQRCDLIGKYVGHTAPMTQNMIEKSLGGVLFIDEAYSIASYIQDEAGKDFGAECISTLLKGMEDHRNELCVIFAGYTKEMQHLLSVNPGFASRIQFTINFPDYSSEELYNIFKDLCKKEKYKLSSNIKPLLLEHFDIAKKQENFANARYVRNIFEKVKMEQANRAINENGNKNLIKKVDIENAISDYFIEEPTEKIKIGFAC